MTLPAPLIPPDVNLQGMDYFPRYIERLRRSRGLALAAADPAGGFSMFCLWDESWWSLPAGSLENDDLLLAGAARCPLDQWPYRKRVALYGWKLCSDGRLYHPVICDVAWGVWKERLKHKHKNECDRIAKANKRALADQKARGGHLYVEHEPIPTYEAWVRKSFPATAARLYAAAAPSVPPQAAPPASAPANGLLPDEMSARHMGAVAQNGVPVSSTGPPCLSETALKYKGKDNNSPPYPPLPGRGEAVPEEGLEGARAVDFAAFMEAVGQPEAPLRTSWTAWCEVLPQLPPRDLLLAEVAAWRANHAGREQELKRRIRPMGPQRLLREGTLFSFEAAARELLSQAKADGMAAKVRGDKAAKAREVWGVWTAPLIAKLGEPVFMAWLADTSLLQEDMKLVVRVAREFQRGWIANHFAGAIESVTGLAVVVERDFGREATA